MKEKNNIEEGFLFDAEEIGKQKTDAQTSEGTESTDAPRRRGRKRSMVTDWNSLQFWQCLTSLKGRHC